MRSGLPKAFGAGGGGFGFYVPYLDPHRLCGAGEFFRSRGAFPGLPWSLLRAFREQSPSIPPRFARGIGLRLAKKLFTASSEAIRRQPRNGRTNHFLAAQSSSVSECCNVFATFPWTVGPLKGPRKKRARNSLCDLLGSGPGGLLFHLRRFQLENLFGEGNVRTAICSCFAKP